MSTNATRTIMGAQLSRMIDAFEGYCAAFYENEGRVIGEDGYASEFASDIANSLSMLLSCERGEQDGGELSRRIIYICQRNGLEAT